MNTLRFAQRLARMTKFGVLPPVPIVERDKLAGVITRGLATW